MSQYIRSQVRSGALGALRRGALGAVDYLNPDPSFAAHWVSGGDCVGNKSGTKVDPDACEGEYSDWYKAQQAVVTAKAAGIAPPTRYVRSTLPSWAMPAAVAGGALLLVLVLKKK